MCTGPIKIYWGNENDETQVIDGKLLLLLGLDLVRIDKNYSNYASRNEYDFYFQAKEEIIAEGAKLCFWFPFQCKRSFYDKNNGKRKNLYFEWQDSFLKQTLASKDPKSARSFGWNENEARKFLPITDGDSVSEYLSSQLGLLRETKFATDFNVDIVEQPLLKKNGLYKGHLFNAILNGKLKKGDFFHIYFILDTVEAQGDPDSCSGNAILLYYDQDLSREHDYHPCARYPTVPCALMQLTMLFPYKLDKFKPHNFEEFDFRKPLDPQGEEFEAGRWFVICNPHGKIDAKQFKSYWRVKSCKAQRKHAKLKRTVTLLTILVSVLGIIVTILIAY